MVSPYTLVKLNFLFLFLFHDNCLLLGVDCFSIEPKSFLSKSNDLENSSTVSYFSCGYANSFFTMASFIPFASKVGTDIFVVDKPSHLPSENLSKFKNFKHPVFTDMSFPNDFNIMSSPFSSIPFSLAILYTFSNKRKQSYPEK